jgi:hypothetical protein
MVNIKNKKVEEAKRIVNKPWTDGKDGYQYVGIGGLLNKENTRQFVEELENFVNKWDWRIFQYTNRIDEYRSR